MNLKQELGTELYDEIISILKDSETKKEEFKNFDKEKLGKIEKIYMKYRRENVPMLLLWNFLICYQTHTGHSNIFSKKEKMVDVTIAYPYSELVAEKYKDSGIFKKQINNFIKK